MRPITKTTICAIIAVAMAAPAFAASSNYYLRLDDLKGGSAAKAGGGKQLEILSWSWGATQAERVNLNSSKSNRELAVSDPGASGPKTTGKRQHGWVTVSKPLDRGAVRVKVKFPWLDCRAGAAFPDAVLQNAAGRYELKEVMITSCSSGGDRPMESISLNYAKVQARGWDPAKK